MAQKTDTYNWVHEHRMSVLPFFMEKWDEAEESKKFIRMAQYSDKQLAAMAKDSRVPYVLDFITQPINTFQGDQRSNRTDIKYLPVEADDDVRTELLNSVKSTILRQNKYLWLLSDIFQDGIIEKAGYIGYEWSTAKDPMGRLDMFRVPQRQMMWSTHRREYELSDASWVSRSRLYNKRDLIRKYPEHEVEIEEMNFTDSAQEELNLDASYFKQIQDSKLDAVALIEFYEKDYKIRHFIKSGKEVRDGYYDEKENAEAKARELTKMMEQNSQPGQAIEPLTVFARYQPVILKSEIAHNIDFVSKEETKEPFYPYDSYHPFWDDGEYWAVMDLYKDPQRFINKIFSQVDNQINKAAKGLTLVDDNVPEPTFQEMVTKWNTTGGIMKFPNPKENVLVIKQEAFDARLLESVSMAIQNIDRKTGGRNFTGGKESAAESGVAVQKRVDRASVASFMIFDNLDRFQLNVGEKVAWYITHFMDAPRKVRIEGEELTRIAQEHFQDWFSPSIQPGVGFIKINTRPINTLTELTVDTIIDQSAHSVTKNQETLQMIQGMLQSSQMLAETIPPQLLIQLFDLPFSIKQEMMKAAQELLQARQEAAKAEQNKPPTLSANLKDVVVLPPSMQPAFLALFGLQSDGTPIEDSTEREKQQKQGLTMLQQAAELEFKDKKHNDQIGLKMIDMKNKDANEKEKIEIARKKSTEKPTKPSKGKR